MKNVIKLIMNFIYYFIFHKSIKSFFAILKLKKYGEIFINEYSFKKKNCYFCNIDICAVTFGSVVVKKV